MPAWSANCVSCHNGVLAEGKGPTHIASNNTCENCHTTLAWMPAHFDHQGVTASCVSCHNGVDRSGKPARHMQTIRIAAPATARSRGLRRPSITSASAPTCQSCHNGVAATGKQAHTHTTQDCGSCHNTLNWTTTTAAAPPLRPLLTAPARRDRRSCQVIEVEALEVCSGAGAYYAC